MRKKRERTKFSMKSLKKAEFMVVLSMVIFVLALISVSLFAGVSEIVAEFKKMSLPLVASLLGLSFVNYFSRGMKWHVFACRLGFGVPLKRMALYYLSGMSMVVTPGKVGTALRLWFLNRLHGISYSRGLPLMVMDPVTDLASLFMMCLAGGALFSGHLLAVLAFGGILTVILTLFLQPKLFVEMIKLTYRLTGRKKPRLFATFLKITRFLSRLVTPKVFCTTVFFSLIGWSATVLAFMWTLHAMGAEHISFVSAMFVFSFATILGGATMAPGGLGGTEAAMVALLVAMDVPFETALAATTVIRLTTLWFGVLFGFTLLPFALKIAREKVVEKTTNA